MVPKTIFRFGLLLLAATLCTIPVRGNDLETPESRHARKKVTPVLPEIARRMQLKGIVRLEATVSPAGKVTAVRAIGGHPILVEAATVAIKDWVFEPSAQSDTTLVTVEFK